ncbi:M16 family metallopeptidase [Mesorhizobium onobrychidis]|uniref:Insulinase family protein n=1 Tax=Mesorhizobium onobrychidis TaxID=2775404 RepID=A0ABY5QW54_9HYPH|nr:pitrilysin family protein [Mesorhizobium onobrychidis]UVC15313.1 insulinase family protein [Mesorhizobium onobrychidis]
MNLRSGWLRGTLFATALAFVTTAPVLAATDDTKATHFLLDNGMKVVVNPDHHAPIVTHMVLYMVGSADEPPGKSGIAYLIEHLMFKGTANHAAGELNRIVAEIGCLYHAFISHDYTALCERVAPSELGQMMSFEADRMRNLTLTDDAIDTERDVILEERRLTIDNDPQAVLDEEVVTALWQSQPYRIPVIGWMHEIEKLNRTDAVAFYDRYYRPNNAVLVVAGDVEPETVKALAEKTYGKVPRGPELPPRDRPSEPVQNTRRTLTLSDGRVSVPSFTRHWVVPSYRTAEAGEAEALDLLAQILGAGNRSRLYQQLVVKQGIAAEARAFFQGAMRDDSHFSISGSPRGDAKLADIGAAVDAEIARIARNGVTSDELERTKERYVRSVIFAQDSIANMYGLTLATGGNVKDVEEWPDRIRKVTADQVKAVAARYLTSDHSTTGYLLPKEN